MKNSQTGFGTLGVVILVISITLVVLGGVYVWSHRSGGADESPVANSQNQPPKTYVDTAKVFEFTYPASWTAINPPHCCEGPAPDPLGQPSQVVLTYPNAPKRSTDGTSSDYSGKNTVSVSPIQTKSRALSYNDTFKNAEKATLNGYELLTTKTTEQYGYQDHFFLISNGVYDIVFMFRAKQTTQAGLGAAAYDESDKLPAIRNIVNSVKFK
ncbi:MAG TPA: hypothetical protein VJ836_06055 [Candidatus Saccharimonadales bacterium]|nr:hypothetical protein [Candidatus Saccharimonadales bacterium]